MWVGGVELPALGSVTKRFSRACYLLLSCFLTVTLVGREGRRQVTWHVLRTFPCGVCHVASIVYSDSCSFVYGFVLCCEMVMAPWQSFIYLQDAWDALETVEGGNEQWSQKCMTQIFFSMLASSQRADQFIQEPDNGFKYSVSALRASLEAPLFLCCTLK